MDSGTQKQLWKDRATLTNLDHYYSELTQRTIWLTMKLKKLQFDSLFEVGYFSGRTLEIIHTIMPNIKIGGISFSNLYDSSSDNRLVDFITNNQYSIKGDYCFENILSHDLICDNPMSKLFTLYYTLYNADFTTNSGTLNDSILIFELKPYLFDRII